MTDQLETIQALERQLAESAAQHRRAEQVQRALYAIADAASAVTGLQAFYARLHEIIGELMYARNFYIAIWDGETKMLSWPYHVEERNSDTWESSLQIEGGGAASHVIRTGRTLHLAADGARLVNNGELKHLGPAPEDAILVPLRANDTILGALAVQSYSPGVGYTSQDVQLLEFVAQHVATALTRMRLVEETAQRNNELAILHSIQGALAAKLDMQAIYDLVGDKICEIFDHADVNIRIYDAGTNMVHYPYYRESGKRLVVPSTPLESHGFEAHIIRTRECLVINEHMEQAFEKYGSYLMPGEHLEKSSVFVPLIVGGQARGLINLKDMEHEFAYGESDVSLLTTLGNSLSVALEDARLLDEARRHTQEVTTLAEIGREISATLDLSTVLERIASYAMSLLHARDVVLRLLEPDGRLHAVVAIGKYAEIYKDWDAHLGQGLSGSVAQSGTAEIVNHPENDPRVIDIAGTEEDKSTRALLCAPLLIGETGIGVLSVWRDRTEFGPFAQADLDFGLSLARQAAIAIQNARLFAETQERFRETEILRAANMELTKSLDLDTILSTLLDFLQQLVPYDSGSVFLLKEDENRLTAVAARGYEQWVANPEKAVGITFDFKRIPHIRSVMEDQTTLIIPDVTRHPGWVVAETATHVRNWLAVPLVAGNKTIGMYSLDKVQPGYFTTEHQRLAESLAAQAAVAFQNATLYRNQQVAHEQAETLRAAASALGSTLSLPEVFELILSELRKVVPYDSCSVQQLDGNEMVIVGGHGFPNLDQLLGNRFDWRRADDPAGEVVQRHEPVIIADVSARFSHFKDATHGRGRVHGWMGVPLLFGERLIGMLTLDKLEQDFYTSEHAHLAQAFAAQAATAIENARLFETEQLARQQAEAQGLRMAALNRVAQAVTSTLDLRTMLEIAAREMVSLLNARSAGVGLLNKERSQLRVVAYYSQSDEPSAVGLTIPLEGNIATQQVIETNQSILITDAQNTPLQDEATRLVMRARNTHCILILPLLARGEVIGTIAPDIDQPNRAFTPEEVQLAQTIASQIAGAIENARLFDEAQRLLKETEQRAAELEIINSVQEGLASKLDMQAIYELVGDKIREIFHADTTYIFSYDAGDQLASSRYYMDRGHSQPPRSLPIGQGLYSRVIQTHEPLIMSSSHQGLALGMTPVPSPETDQDLNQSGVYVPILRGDEVRGVVSVQSYEEDHFHENDARLLAILAGSMSVALENARLFDETQRLLKETEQRAAELAIINSVQAGLASKLEMQAIYELVGEKIREVFSAQVVDIVTYDRPDDLLMERYSFEKGDRRLWPEPMPSFGFRKHVIQSREALVINRDAEQAAARFGNPVLTGAMPKSNIFVPMMAGGEVTGIISLQDLDHEDAFGESDVRLLQTLANSMSVALENARLFDETQRLLKESEQRAAELSVINSVQRGLASKLEMQAIYDLVGDKVRDIFQTEVVYIAVRDVDRPDRFNFPYYIDQGRRLALEPVMLGEGITSRVIESGQPVLVSSREQQVQLGAIVEPGDQSQSYLGVPILLGDRVMGVASLQSYRTDAFGPADVRLLSTLAASMGVALENARLFDETQRLLKETEQRNAELAVINSVQGALAAKLDIQAIYDAVGEKVGQIFPNADVGIRIYDAATHLVHFPYSVEGGQKVRVDPIPRGSAGISNHVLSTRQPLVMNRNVDGEAAKYGSYTIPGTRSAKASVFVPLVVGEEARGIISLEDTEHENAFAESDVRLLTTVANSMSIALENARLFDETQRLLKETERRAAELSAISTVSQALVAETDLNKMIELIGGKLRGIFKPDIAYVALLDRATNTINFPYAYGDEFPALRYGEGLTSKIIETSQPLLINRDLEKKRAELGTQRVGRQAASYLGVPILAGGQAIGVISVQSTTAELAFDEGDRRLLSTIAANAGAAIRNAQLHGETQRRAREMATLAEIGNDIAASRELEPVLERIADHALQILHVRDITVSLRDPDGQTFRNVVALGRNPNEMKGLVIAPGRGILGGILQSGKAEIVNHPMQDPRRIHIPGTPEEEDERECIMGAPLTSRGEAIGGIMVWRQTTDGLFTDSELDFLVSVARQTAIAIESARLYLETQRRANEMSALADVGREISSTLEPAVVLQRIAARAKELLHASSSAVYLVGPDKSSMKAITALGEIAHEIEADTIRFGEGIIGTLALEGRAEFVNDTSNDPRGVRIPGTGDVSRESLMVTPLFRGAEVTGMMAVWRMAEPFNELDLNFLVGLSRQAAIALENARLFEEIKRQGQYLETIFTNSPVAIVTVDENGRVLTWSPAAEKLFGYSREEALGRDVDDLVANSSEVREEAQAYTRQGMGNQYVHRITKRTRKDGTLVDVDLSALPLPLEGGKTGVIAIYNDVGEIQRQRQYYEAIVQNSPVAIVTVDEHSNVVSWNPGAEQMFGYGREQAIGRNIDEMVAATDDLRAQAEAYNRQAIRKDLHVITQRTRKDRSIVEVELAGVPLPLPTGESGLVAIYHDITELQRARREAVAANEAKSAFLATMSHEIRTPMNAVIGMSGLLMDTQLTREQHDYAETIRNSGDALLAIINDILDFSKIEAGKMDLEQQPFDLRECVESALDLVAGRAVEKNLDLAYIVDDDVPTGIKGDVTRLRQILLNLLSNAVKFTEKGEVVLTVKRDQGADRLLFAVRDTGIGIPHNRMDRLFTSFSQADSSTTRRYGGTGLGLAISKRLAEMMGGTMWAESGGSGKGSAFSFTISAEPARVTERKTAREMRGLQPALENKRVLIVDDNATNRRILMLQTAKWGMLPRETASPREALRWLKRGQPFDIAILDLQMPEMDGIMLTRELRQFRDAHALPIILLTSLGRKEVGAEDLGFSAYLTKPLKPSALFDAVAGIFARNLVAPRAEVARALIDTEMARNHPLRILLAEDNAVNQKLALRLLEQMGYRADVASNGLEAVESLERQSYDVILMDVQMPEMDGLDATRQIRKLKDRPQPRIVAMTANAMQGDREMCIAAGMDDYVSKPIRVAELSQALLRTSPLRTHEDTSASGQSARKRLAKKKAPAKAASSRASQSHRKQPAQRARPSTKRMK